MTACRVLLVDDHALVRAGIRALLESLPRVEVAQAAEGVEALEDGLGERGEVLEAAQLVEAAAERVAGPVDHFPVALVQDARNLQVLDVPQELLPVARVGVDID